MRRLIALVLGAALGAGALHAEVFLTVYQRDLVLVRDTRTVDLTKGENRIAFEDIAPGIYQPTLRIIPLKEAGSLSTVEVNYEFDLADQNRIWRKFIGKPFEFTKDDSLYKGILRNFDDDYIYLEPEGKPGGISLVERSGVENAVFDALPEGLVLRPQVSWVVQSDRPRESLPVEISYLANGLTWQVDYAVHVLDERRIRLQGNLTLDNTMDMDFPQARLDLIAGKPHRTGDAVELTEEDAFQAPEAAGKEAAGRFFEYPHYLVPGTTTLHASQTKSIPLIGPVVVAAERSFFFDGSSGAETVQIRLAFVNTRDAGLGIALPEGDLLVYQQDDRGADRFLGEDHLAASSPGDRVELVVGQAFDLRVDRRRVEHARLARNRTRDTVEIVLSSSRRQTSPITVRERLYGYWSITEATWGGSLVSPRAEDANRVEFDLQLAPGATDTLRYVVEYGY